MSIRRALFSALAAVLFVQAAGVRVLVVSGDSMAPLIHDGDLVLIAYTLRDGRVGDVVLVERPSDGVLLLHRVIHRDTGWRTTKGDASKSPDIERIPDEQLIGGLALVIPTGLLGALRIGATTAQFTDVRATSLKVTSARGAHVQVESPVLLGDDTAGRLLPGGSATWKMRLTPCPSGVAGECAGLTNTLRIDPARFTAVAADGIARSLRISTRCRAMGGSAWATSSDLFTAAWSATSLVTGRMTTMESGAIEQECEVSVTLLGSISAINSAVQLPLRWGPE